MKQYIGTKIIFADPQAKDGAEGYAVVYADGYKSWSPKEVFEAAYRQCDAMTFGLAVDALKLGHKVARAGWNGKGMWLRLINPYAPHPDSVPGFASINPGAVNPYFKACDNNPLAEGTMLPWIGMKTADNKFVPWLASQTDVLAEDWVITETL